MYLPASGSAIVLHDICTLTRSSGEDTCTTVLPLLQGNCTSDFGGAVVPDALVVGYGMLVATALLVLLHCMVLNRD